MRVRYIYSACVVIESATARVCCDPWFTPGAYDGSWYQYPPLAGDALGLIGQVDAVFVSHIHPDHYDPVFLRRYLSVYPGTRLLIGATAPAYLQRRMLLDGFKPEVVESTCVGDLELLIVPNHGYEGENIDTALAVRANGKTLVNLNDNPIDEDQLARLREWCGGAPTVALLPYAGAGPYPQTYEFESQAESSAAAFRKREQFIGQFERYLQLLQPSRAIPFAGKYWLGGPLSALNALRGVPDAVEVAERFPGVAVVLEDGAHAFLDLDTLEASHVRERAYDQLEVSAYLATLNHSGYRYEQELKFASGRALPLLPLVRSAHQNARRHAEIGESFWFCIRTPESENYMVFDVATDSDVVLSPLANLPVPRAEISIDARYLFGLLTRLYHWDNAAIGSHYRCRRVPDVYRRQVYGFLVHFHV